MPELPVTCPEESAPAAGCYIPFTAPSWLDCTTTCVQQATGIITSPIARSLAEAIGFGAKFEELALRCTLQDYQLLQALLLDLFTERIYRTAAGDDPGNAGLWTENDLGCVVRYFTCRYGVNIRSILLTAGLYDPTHPPAQAVVDALPLPYSVPCGDPAPPTPEPPDPWPPQPDPCGGDRDHDCDDHDTNDHT